VDGMAPQIAAEWMETPAAIEIRPETKFLTFGRRAVASAPSSLLGELGGLAGHHLPAFRTLDPDMQDVHMHDDRGAVP